MAVKSACDSIQNSDSRCAHQNDYVIGDVIPRIGYFNGAAQVLTLMPKSMDVKFVKLGYADYVYLKVQAEAGKLGTVLEVASVPGDGKCHWSGLPLAGGTVCPASRKPAMRASP